MERWYFGDFMNWYKKASRNTQEHINDVVNADLDSPIFITKEYEIIDGAHRTCKSHLLGQKIRAIILSQEDINKALLPEDSDYVGQIYRDDNKNEYSVTKLLELYRNRKTKIMDPEVIIKQSENVWGKSIDIYDILKKAKIKMEKSKIAKENANFPFSIDLLWQEISVIFSDIKTNVPLPKKIGSINDISVFIVDGEKIKRNKNRDFVAGGHDLTWDFIHNNEIWIDARVNTKDIPSIIYREYLERYLMSKYDMTQNDAHDFIINKE